MKKYKLQTILKVLPKNVVLELEFCSMHFFHNNNNNNNNSINSNKHLSFAFANFHKKN